MKLPKLRYTIPAFLAALYIIFWATLALLPFPELKAFTKRGYSVTLQDRNGHNLLTVPLEEGLRREYCDIDSLPPFIPEMFIRAEDRRFYFHPGVDPAATVRAAWLNSRNSRQVSGASTITMQLSRIVAPHEGGYRGKIIEMFNALKLEARLSKKEILSLWLNSIPFGYNSEGIATASKTFYAQPVETLSPAQVLSLAVIPRSPARYNPISSSENAFSAVSTLAKGLDYSLSEREIKRALEQAKGYQWEFEAPHFTGYVKERLGEKGPLPKGIVKTSLDLDLNRRVEGVLRAAVAGSTDARISTGAVLLLDNRTGEIVSYVGSADFNDVAGQGQIDGVRVLNQPGSTLKPFLYAQALENGFSANSILPDIPLEFGGSDVYIPLNYNRRYNGPVRLRVALASSLNVTSVYLVTRVGVDAFTGKLLDAGFHSLEEQRGRLGSGIALGNAEVSLLELTRAFAVFARKGEGLTESWLKSESGESESGESESGESVSGESVSGELLYSEETAALICDILGDDMSRALGFGTGTLLKTAFPAIFKTGTSNQFNNIWTVGSTKEYTVGVWMGNFSGETVIGRTGSSLPASIAVKVLTMLSEEQPGEEFILPDSLKKVLICPLSGKKRGTACTGAVYDYIKADSTIESCDFHQFEGGRRVTKYPPLYTSWARNYLGSDEGQLKDESAHFPTILKPRDGATFYYDPHIKADLQAIKIEVLHDNPADRLNLLINGRLVKRLAYPFEWYFPLQRGEWTVEVNGWGKHDSVRIVVK